MYLFENWNIPESRTIKINAGFPPTLKLRRHRPKLATEMASQGDTSKSTE